MWNCINFIMIHYRRTNAHRTRTFTYFYFLESTISLFLEHGFTTVIRNVYPAWFKLHQWIEVIVNAIDCLSFQRR